MIDWCDANGFSDVFSSVDATRLAYLAYNDYLHNQVLVNKALKPQTCRASVIFYSNDKMIFDSDSRTLPVDGVPSIRSGEYPTTTTRG